jgi:hypothetical protein
MRSSWRTAIGGAVMAASMAATAAATAGPASDWAALAPIRGSLLFTCGRAPGTGELYFKDDGGTVHQLTVTQPKAGAESAVWQGDRIVAVIDRDFHNRLEVRRLDTPPAEVGRQLRGEGFSPAASRTGEIAYLRPSRDREADQVVRLRNGHRRVAAQRRLLWDVAWVGGRLLALSEYASHGRMELIDVTRRPARRVVRLRRTRIGSMAIGGRHRVAYWYGRGRPGHIRLAVMSLDGSHRRAFRVDWAPKTWSPDGRRILVNQFGGRSLGLMSPRTGKVRVLGRLPCGSVKAAVWARPGEHPWPRAGGA